ncbi:MAG: AzlD domain-containing protein [Candidatus Puniceispirillaceae bacterium]
MIWFLIIVSGLITFSMRFIFLTPAMPANLSPLMLTAMRLVPIAVLWTIVVAEVFLQNGAIAELSTNVRLYAALGAAVIVMVTKSVIGTIIGGMSLYWGLSYLLG